jgi:biopolymer transport protein ExbD
MAEKRRILDVWVVDTNTVYREVPFTVVTDWIQQGRLLPDDKARPSGKGGWFRLAEIPAFAAFFPKPEPYRVEDEAEALERVEMDIPTRPRHDHEEDDPDMIPLIDVTLVLLVFFMMTAAVSAGLFSPIDTPPAKYQVATIESGTFWVGIDRDKKGEARYSLGQDEREIQPGGADLEPVRVALRKELAKVAGEVKVRIRADKTLPSAQVQVVMERLGQTERAINKERESEPGSARLKFRLEADVSEPQ